MFEKWKTNVEIVGSGAESCCDGVWHRFLRVGCLWMNGGMIGEAIYVGVCDGKWSPVAAGRGGVLARSCGGGSAVFRVYTSLTSHGCSGSVGAVRGQRSLGLCLGQSENSKIPYHLIMLDIVISPILSVFNQLIRFS